VLRDKFVKKVPDILNKKYLILVLFTQLAMLLSAQSVTSYSCDFEDMQENQRWVRNVGARAPQCENKWYIGAAGSFGPYSTKGMYVSSGVDQDTVQSIYTAKNWNYIVTYRTINLAAGNYTLMFDWIGQGQSDDAMYVAWIDDATTNTNSNTNTKSKIAAPAWLPVNAVKCQGSSMWKSTSATFTSTGQTGKLVVVFYNVRGTAVTPSFAIDNIEIMACSMAAPTNITYNGNTKSISWKGTASAYDVMVYNYHTKTTNLYSNIQGKSMTLSDLTEEGMYYFYVRATDGADCHSTWAFTSKFVWIKGARCIDFLDLTSDNSGAAKCFYTDQCEYGGAGYSNLYEHSGQVDYGYDKEQSRHTIHYMVGETDPRTENKLKTIPDGEIASVRVNGFWESAGDHASTIEYDYQVQAGVSDLLILQYACVLENPEHDEDEQPRFKLEVLHNGQVIDQCAQCDLKAGFGDAASWHVVNPGTYNRVDWCDWQSITISLRNYVGATLKLRLTAYDCTLSGHYGYAYFTLNCKGGDLEGIACGDYSTDHFDAPDGFNYRWYKATQPKNILATTQRFNIDKTDTCIYCVDVINKVKSQCYYTLTANPNPRFPEAKATATVTSANCQNTVSFLNQSAVVIVNRKDSTHTYSTEELGSMYWDFGDGEFEANLDNLVTHVYPAEGGQFQVKCIAGMSADVCQDTYIIDLELPNLLNSDMDTTIHTCDSIDIDSHGKPHYARDSAYYVDTVGVVKNKYGCEALKFRTVYFHPTYDTLYTVRICEGTPYVWPADGKTYTVTTKKTHNVPTAIWGCDSVMRLDLTVDPALRVDYADTVVACYDSALIHVDYQILSGDIDSVFVFFPESEMQQGFDSVYKFVKGAPVFIPLPDNTSLPGNHQAFVYFNGEFCSLDPIPFCVQVQYPTSIVMMTDGFIGVQNVLYNGGWQFADFTWYRNGQLLDNHQSYIPVTKSDVGAVYTVSLRREGENYTISSCPIKFHLWTGLQSIAADAEVEVYSMLGMYVGQFASLSEATHALPAGIYIIRDINQTTQTVLVH